MNIRVGTAPDSWGIWFPSDPQQIPGGRFLDVVAEEGYTDHSGPMARPTRLDDRTQAQFIEAIHKVARLAQTDPGLMSFCLDTGWLADVGGDPVRFMRRHHTRIPYLHLKS